MAQPVEESQTARLAKVGSATTLRQRNRRLQRNAKPVRQQRLLKLLSNPNPITPTKPESSSSKEKFWCAFSSPLPVRFACLMLFAVWVTDLMTTHYAPLSRLSSNRRSARDSRSIRPQPSTSSFNWHISLSRGRDYA